MGVGPRNRALLCAEEVGRKPSLEFHHHHHHHLSFMKKEASPSWNFTHQMLIGHLLSIRHDLGCPWFPSSRKPFWTLITSYSADTSILLPNRILLESAPFLFPDMCV